MSTGMIGAWLDDATLTHLAGRVVDEGTMAAMWAQRYDPTCPSEFYRGYATLLLRIGDAFRSNATVTALRQFVDAFDRDLKVLPDDERRNGAAFALMNVASYAQVGTSPQIAATLASETTCIARCFIHSRANGL